MSKRKSKKQALRKAAPAIPKTNSLKGQPAWFKHIKLHCWFIFALGCLIYLNTIGHDYTQDDAIVISDNEFTTQGLKGIPGILKYDTFRGFFKVEGKDKLVAGGRYRPLTLVMFATEVQLFGQQPWIGHLVNILLYGLTGVVLYLLLLQLGFSGNYHKRQLSWWVESATQVFFIALTTTLLWIAHPIHTEAVANIKGRDEIMTLLGSLVALYFSLKAYYRKKPLLNALAALFFFLALLSKENAITFLAIVPLTYYFFTKAKWSKIGIQVFAFVGAALVFLLIRSAILGTSLGASSMELMNNPFVKLQGNTYVPFSGGEKWATIIYTLGKYVQLLIFPHPLTHDYYPRHIPIMHFGDWKVILSALVYIGMGIYALIGFKKKDPISYGILFFLASISIASNIVFPIGTNMSERFAYMPSIGYTLVVAILLYRLSKLRTPNKKLTQFKQLNWALAIVGVLTILMAIKTFSRNFAWKDNYTLFTTDIKTSPNSAKLRNAVGGELSVQSVKINNDAQRISMLKEAEGHLLEGIKIHPTYKNIYLQLGNVNNYLKQYEPSLQYYDKALALDPNYQDAIKNKNITLREAGEYYGKEQGNTQKAIQFLERAHKEMPNDFETVHSLGVAYGLTGNTQKATQLFSIAVQLQPENINALNNLASAYGLSGNHLKAIETFKRIVQLEPNNANALFNMGTAYANAGNAAKAQEYQQKAIQIDPTMAKGLLEN